MLHESFSLQPDPAEGEAGQVDLHAIVHTIARGGKVELRRAQLNDRARVYRWMTQSDLTAHVMGAPLYDDYAVRSEEAFAHDFAPHYFDGSRLFDGRALIVHSLLEKADIGFIAYNRVSLLRDVVELDIWLESTRVCGRGYGSESLALLCDWLQNNLGVNRFLVRPSRRNIRALRAMRRAGFRETDLPHNELVKKLALPRGDYADEVLLFRVLPVQMPHAFSRASMNSFKPNKTMVFVDSEFTSLEDPRLISVGAVATDGAAFYSELTGWPEDDCSPFVQSTVLPLLEGGAMPHPAAAQAFTAWLQQRAAHGAVTIVSDSGFDRWALADLLSREDLPAQCSWLRAPVAYDELDDIARTQGLRRHHALDDARALRYAVLNPQG